MGLVLDKNTSSLHHWTSDNSLTTSLFQLPMQLGDGQLIFSPLSNVHTTHRRQSSNLSSTASCNVEQSRVSRFCCNAVSEPRKWPVRQSQSASHKGGDSPPTPFTATSREYKDTCLCFSSVMSQSFVTISHNSSEPEKFH